MEARSQSKSLQWGVYFVQLYIIYHWKKSNVENLVCGYIPPLKVFFIFSIYFYIKINIFLDKGWVIYFRAESIAFLLFN